MTTREWWSRSRLELAASLSLVMALAVGRLVACDPKTEPTLGSETHFLMSCDASCPKDSSCYCGVCTRACADASECSELDKNAVCAMTAPRIAEGRCLSTVQSSVCEVNCLTDADCASLAGDFTCQAGVCRVDARASISDQSAPAHCVDSKLASGEVLILGDALIELTTFVSRLEQNATAAHVLAEGEHFRDQASAMTSVLSQAGALSFFEQYSDARQQGNARVIVMDGGETDMLNADCAPELSYACPIIAATVAGYQKLLKQFADDGVEHLVYFFYPDPRENDKLKSHLDALRPLFENACGQSPVACHWIDLKASFSGNASYLGADGIVLSEAGANVAADLVWQRMQERCIVSPQ